VITVLLGAIFWFTYLIAGKSAMIAKVFPTRDCNAITSAYGGYLETYAAQD
jgi:hypothetical protein